MSDLFKEMQAKIGCQYLSDLPYYKRAVWYELRRMPLGEYGQEQLENFARYVFGVRYSVLKEVMDPLEAATDSVTP